MSTMIRHGLRHIFQFFLGGMGKLVAIPIRRRLRAFDAATNEPEKVQTALLQSILARQKATQFGRDHHFDAIQNVADFRRNLPIAGYDYYEPYLARVRRGETSALLSDPRVYMFALTSGTTATRKFIPVTAQYLADYRRGWNIWGLKLFTDHPDIKFRPIVQLSGDWQEMHTESGIPCGAVTGLTATMQKKIVRWLYCVPPGIGKIKDSLSKYYLVLRLGMPRDVALIIAANPSTLINLARAGDLEKESLIRDIAQGTLSDRFDIPGAIREAVRYKLAKEPGRARELEAIAARTGHLFPKDYWTKPCMLGNWTGGSMGAYLRQYPRYFGDMQVRDVGLIASEGRMTIPFANGTPAGILDITSHYFEFIPEGEIESPQPTVLGAHELSEGATYYILPTTAYGLYRYQIHDVVRVAGFHNRTPLLEFLSKGSLFANVTGEKLSEYHVTQAMPNVLHRLDLSLSAYTVAPCWDDALPYYGLFLERGEMPEEAAKHLAAGLDDELKQINVEYQSKRDSQRLGALRIEWLPPGFWQNWDRERLRRTGGALEQYKRPCLLPDAAKAGLGGPGMPVAS